MGDERLAESEYQSEYHATLRGPKPPFYVGLWTRPAIQIPPSPLTESFETIDEPEAKSESEARSFCEISESERKRRLNLANRTSY